jgi:hypothetical protein
MSMNALEWGVTFNYSNSANRISPSLDQISVAQAIYPLDALAENFFNGPPARVGQKTAATCAKGNRDCQIAFGETLEPFN